MIVTIGTQSVDSDSVRYRILSLLEQLAQERKQFSREHEEYRHRGQTEACDLMADSIGMKREDLYDGLDGKRIFSPLERKNIASYLTVHERDIWYGRPKEARRR